MKVTNDVYGVLATFNKWPLLPNYLDKVSTISPDVMETHLPGKGQPSEPHVVLTNCFENKKIHNTKGRRRPYQNCNIRIATLMMVCQKFSLRDLISSIGAFGSGKVQRWCWECD